MKIFKYSIPLKDEFTLMLPKDAEILSFQSQLNDLFIWVCVNENAELVKRWFILRGTGHELDIPRIQLNYIDTAQMNGGNLVWHLFEDIT